MRKLSLYIICLSFLATSCFPLVTFQRKGDQRASRKKIVITARKYLGTPYRHGGSSPRGFDCSGFVMYVYKKNGIKLPRTVKSQFDRGNKIRKRRLRPGDLVFFRTSRRKRFSHVGIYMGRRRFIHAPRTGKNVSYSKMDNPYWRRRFIGSVTYLRHKRSTARI